MTRQLSIHNLAMQLKEASDSDDWSRVDECRTRLKTLLLEAVMDDLRQEIAQIEKIFSEARGRLVFGRLTDLSDTPTAAAWMLAADSETARQAARLRPAPVSVVVEKSARDKVLGALRMTNRNGVSNIQISNQTGLPPETVARVLKVLREEGRVVSNRAGRQMINRLITKLDIFSGHNRSFSVLLQSNSQNYIINSMNSSAIASSRQMTQQSGVHSPISFIGNLSNNIMYLNTDSDFYQNRSPGDLEDQHHG